MKKIVCAILVSALVLSTLTACGTGDVGDSEYMASQQAAENNAAQQQTDEYMANAPAKEPGLESMKSYFVYNGYVVSGTEQEVAEDMIGAINGIRYSATFGSSVFTVELYEYDTSNLSDTAKKIIDEINTTGSFIMLGQNIPAEISDNGKYLMVYTDASVEQANIDHHTQVSNVFKAWP